MEHAIREATGYSQACKRHSYPKTRADFLPPAYVLLTREIVLGMKERHGYTWHGQIHTPREDHDSAFLGEALTESGKLALSPM
jgi:hypothetical protein